MSIFLSFCKASRMRRAKMNDSDKPGAKPQTKSEGICSRFSFVSLPIIICSLRSVSHQLDRKMPCLSSSFFVSPYK